MPVPPAPRPRPATPPGLLPSPCPLRPPLPEAGPGAEGPGPPTPPPPGPGGDASARPSPPPHTEHAAASPPSGQGVPAGRGTQPPTAAAAKARRTRAPCRIACRTSEGVVAGARRYYTRGGGGCQGTNGRIRRIRPMGTLCPPPHAARADIRYRPPTPRLGVKGGGATVGGRDGTMAVGSAPHWARRGVDCC